MNNLNVKNQRVSVNALIMEIPKQHGIVLFQEYIHLSAREEFLKDSDSPNEQKKTVIRNLNKNVI